MIEPMVADFAGSSSVQIQSPSSPQSTPEPSKSPPITVTPAAVDSGPKQPTPKPGTAKSRMFDDLRKKAGMEPETKPETTTGTQETTTTSPETKPETKPETTTETPETTSEASPPSDKKKVSPWKLVDEHKAARLKAETELAELRKTMADPAKIKEIETKAEAAERRSKELEEEIKYVNYSKSREFQEKYQKPYEDAWKRWMGDLQELTVAGADGNERQIQPNDLLELVNMPLQKAREVAEQTFGSFADDVMGARKEIRRLFDDQQRALEEAKKNGSQRTEQMQKQWREHQEALGKEIVDHWTKANQEAVSDDKIAKFFKPLEGDEEGNKRLAKGYEIADKAFSLNPTDPRLTPQQRADVVRLHAAVRNRAAAFGRLSYQNSQLEAKVKSLMDELGKYRNSDMGGGERKPEPSQAGHTSVRDDVFGALRKLAH